MLSMFSTEKNAGMTTVSMSFREYPHFAPLATLIPENCLVSKTDIIPGCSNIGRFFPKISKQTRNPAVASRQGASQAELSKDEKFMSFPTKPLYIHKIEI